MGIRGDDRPRPRSTTLEEEDLILALLESRITRLTFDRRFKRLKKDGLIQRNGKVIR